MKPRPIRFVDRIHTIHRIGRKTFKWDARGIYFIDPAGPEVRETNKKRAEKVGSSDASSNALQEQE